MNETAAQLRYRIGVALKTLELFRLALEQNGNRYHGGMVPNLTSVTDIFALRYDDLLQQVRLFPIIAPDPRWQGPGTGL